MSVWWFLDGRIHCGNTILDFSQKLLFSRNINCYFQKGNKKVTSSWKTQETVHMTYKRADPENDPPSPGRSHRY